MKPEIDSISWKRGSKCKGKASVALRELEKIKTKNGGVLTAGIVLLTAKSERSPLHKHFQWDDTVAAEEYRLEQSRKLIRSIEVVYVDAPAVEPQRHYLTVTQGETHTSPPRKVYRSTAEIIADPVARDEMLANAIREALAFRRKYAGLQELSQIFISLDNFLLQNKAI